jgi:hypothetical protein
MTSLRPEFTPFQKIPRLTRSCLITEKIDGTNAQVYISDDMATVWAGSRNRWITPEADNYGFARWVAEHTEELLKLGPGPHFGEWWGNGIQRGYGMSEKVFSLFNVDRWHQKLDQLPSCVRLVPTLYRGAFDDMAINTALFRLKLDGSLASPGFMDPEGIIIYHDASRQLFKKTCKDDACGKGAQ